LDPGKRWVTLTGEKWNPDRAVLALSLTLKKQVAYWICAFRECAQLCVARLLAWRPQRAPLGIP